MISSDLYTNYDLFYTQKRLKISGGLTMEASLQQSMYKLLVNKRHKLLTQHHSPIVHCIQYQNYCLRYETLYDFH